MITAERTMVEPTAYTEDVEMKWTQSDQEAVEADVALEHIGEQLLVGVHLHDPAEALLLAGALVVVRAALLDLALVDVVEAVRVGDCKGRAMLSSARLRQGSSSGP